MSTSNDTTSKAQQAASEAIAYATLHTEFQAPHRWLAVSCEDDGYEHGFGSRSPWLFCHETYHPSEHAMLAKFTMDHDALVAALLASADGAR